MIIHQGISIRSVSFVAQDQHGRMNLEDELLYAIHMDNACSDRASTVGGGGGGDYYQFLKKLTPTK